MKKSEELKKQFLYSVINSQKQDCIDTETRLRLIEYQLSHIIDNELAHIWLFIKVILGGLLGIMGGILIALIR